MNQELVDRVMQSPRLPSLPAVALEVLSLSQNPDVDFGRIRKVIEQDPALSSKVLKTANSALYGQFRQVSTVTRALQVMGLRTVKTLALGFSLVGNLKQGCDDGFDHVNYWRRSLFTAAAARSVSRHLRIPAQEETFLGGLLQDVGMLVLHRALADEYDDVLKNAGGNHGALAKREVETLGCTHAEVGGALMEAWQLPPLLVTLIRHHDDPADVDPDLLRNVRTVVLGNRVAEIFLSDQPGTVEALATYYRQAENWFEIGREEAGRLLKEAHETTEAMGQLFELPTGHLGNAEEILALANDTLIELTLESHKENRQLMADVSTDALTGASSRRTFDRFVEKQFGEATVTHPVSALFVDIDHFKRFNDTYGHALGDRVLVVCAKTLQASTGDRGRVFRCGGEEFGIVCPNADAALAVEIGEQARKAVEAATVVSDESEELGVTCSIGVATHAGDTFDSVSGWLKVADECLYAAKSSGRNCVRVFSEDAEARMRRSDRRGRRG